MINQNFFYQPIANQDLSALYTNYMILQQKMAQNSVYQNSINFNSLFSYAVSMDFKKFQTEYLLQEMKKQLFDSLNTPMQQTQTAQSEVTEKKQQKIQKNLNSLAQENDKSQTIQLIEFMEKSAREEPRSKALTSDESSEKIYFDDCSIKENKNTDKKFKKSTKSEKLKELPLIDLVEFALIRKDPFDRSEIQKKKNSLLDRQVQNWNEIQKSRRNEKLELRRIKY